MTDLRRVLVANRGEIAARIIRACFDEGIEAVLATSTADTAALPARLADRTVRIGPPSPAASYLNVDAVVSAALLTGCDAIHPGYGFLSEQPRLARACAEHGLTFIGPSVDTLERGGDKVASRALAASLDIPTSAAIDVNADPAAAEAEADSIGYPLLVKAAAGGGGRGMTLVREPADLQKAIATATREAREAFGDGRIFIERYLDQGRHVEVQILGDGRGEVIHLGDRDCSVQRRYQKLVEEAPAPGLPEDLRAKLHEAAVRLGRALSYASAGTVEFLVDIAAGRFYFLEINTRIQVEHPVTEAVTGIDIVRQQLRIAAGGGLDIDQSAVRINGHAVECRITAEDPRRGFAPAPGVVREWVPPQGSAVRVDTHVEPGYVVPPYYDSLLAKLICHGENRASALATTRRALARFHHDGIPTTVPILRDVVEHPDFVAGGVPTTWLERDFLPGWTG